MILVMGGIHEAKQIYDALIASGVDAVLTVATELGRTQYEGARIERYTLESLTEAARKHGFRAIVDATHPHAAEASRTAYRAACELGIPLIRYARRNPELEIPQGAYRFETVGTALDACADVLGDGRLLVTGVKHLADCLARIPKSQLYVRLMPSAYSIAECEKHAVPLSNLIAIKTPVSNAMNHAIFREFSITDFLFKASGEGSAYASNLRALRTAESAGLPPVRGWIVDPPEVPGVSAPGSVPGPAAAPPVVFDDAAEAARYLCARFGGALDS